MKKSICLIIGFLMLFCFSIRAQKQTSNPFQMVDVPDSISFKLDKAYEESTGFDSVNAGKNVWNLLSEKDFVFKNGLYSFRGQGPDFPSRLFIYNNGKICIFKSNYINDVLEEYLENIKYLGLSEAESLIYLEGISNYLQDELNVSKH